MEMGTPSNQKILKVETIRDVFEQVALAIEQGFGEEVALDENFYWQVPGDDLFRIGETPARMDVGSLWDDASFLATAEKENVGAAGLLLIDHLAPLLVYIASRVK